MNEEPQFKYLTAGCRFKNDTFVIALNRFDYPITILYSTAKQLNGFSAQFCGI